MACLELNPTFENLHAMVRLDVHHQNVFLARGRRSLNGDRHMPTYCVSPISS